MTLLIARSTFDYDGEQHAPGDVLTVPDPGEAERDADYFTRLHLCEQPSTRIDGVEALGGGSYLLCTHGGGWYSVVGEDGAIVVDTVQGRDAAIAAIPSDGTPSEGDSPEGDSTDSEPTE